MLKEELTLPSGLSQLVPPQNVLGLCGIYVDDQCLHQVCEFNFLGVTLELAPLGLLLHQKAYTEALLDEYRDMISQRKRTTTGDPEHFEQSTPTAPDLSNPEGPEHAVWVKRLCLSLLCFLIHLSPLRGRDPKVDVRFYSLTGECAILCTGTPPEKRRSLRARQRLSSTP